MRKKQEVLHLLFIQLMITVKYLVVSMIYTNNMNILCVCVCVCLRIQKDDSIHNLYMYRDP